MLERDGNAHRSAIHVAFGDMACLSSLAGARGLADPLGAAPGHACGLAVGPGRGLRSVPMPADIIGETVADRG